MIRRLLGAFALVAVVLVAFVGIRRFMAPTEAPPIISRTQDARRALQPSFGTHLRGAIAAHFPHAAKPGSRLIALTFDDGPYPVETPLLLDQLEALHVKATFFLIGDDTDLFPDLAARIEADGDEIANHTQTHPANFDALSQAAVRAELLDGARTLHRYATDPAIATMMRPPHGRFTLQTVEAAQRAGYHVILWSDDPGDWRAKATPPVIESHVRAFATAPEILLLHSGKLHSIEALPPIVERFERAGYRFVTVGELMRSVPLAQIEHPAKVRV